MIVSFVAVHESAPVQVFGRLDEDGSPERQQQASEKRQGNDGELIAAGRHGQPDFLALLHGRNAATCVYCFDLLEVNGRDLRKQPLVQRRARLQALLARAKSDLLRFSEKLPRRQRLTGRVLSPRP